MIKLVITPSKGVHRALALMKEWPERTKALASKIPHLAASSVFRDVLDKIPTKPEYRIYRSSLRLAQVSVGAPWYCYAVTAKVKEREIRKVDASETVLYIRSRRRLRKKKPEINILERHNPWTVDTLPFSPLKADAEIVSRRVSKKAVDAVRDARQADSAEWTKALAQAGQKITSPNRVVAKPDLAFEALRGEYGMSGRDIAGHWRLPLMQWKRRPQDKLVEEDAAGELDMTFRKLSYTGWKRWPEQVQYKIGAPEAKSFVLFQKKLGY